MANVNLLDCILWGFFGFVGAFFVFVVLVAVPGILWLRHKKAHLRKRMGERLKEVCK